MIRSSGKLSRIFGWSIGILLVLGAIPTAKAAERRCMSIDWISSAGSNSSAIQAGPNLSFASINQENVVFNTVPGTVVSSGDQVLSSISEGCFSSGRLRIGTNTFKFAFWTQGVDRIYGKTSASFRFEKGTERERLLCRAEKGDGAPNGYNCSGSLQLQLVELDPASASLVQNLRQETIRLEAELRKLKDERPTAQELAKRLDEIAEKDFEPLTSDELLQVSSRLSEVARLVRELQGSLEELRAKFTRELVDQKAYLETIRQMASDALESQGLRVRDEAFFAQYEVQALTLPSIDIPGSGQADTFDAGKNAYLEIEKKAVERLKQAELRADYTDFNIIVEVWSQTTQVLARSIEARGSTVSLRELETFTTSVARVRSLVDELIDRYGFLKSLKLPEDVKQTIQHDIAPVDPQRARRLRDAINSWKGEERTPEQKLVLETTRGLGVALRAASKLPKIQPETAGVLSKLFHVMDQTIEAARMVARVGVAFTPLNDFVDFCEVVTGREFCTPNGAALSTTDRVISAFGLVAGSGQFWRRFGEMMGMERGVATVATETSVLSTRFTSQEAKLFEKIAAKTGRALSRNQKTYLTKLLKSGQKLEHADLERIMVRYGDLELKMKKIQPVSLGEVQVWRGKKTARMDGNAPDKVAEIFKMDSTTMDHRFSIGGELGDNAVYASFGKDEADAIETIRAEMRDPQEPVEFASKTLNPKKCLDLMNPENRKILGLDLTELIRSKEKGQLDAYELPQVLGNLARNFGFDSIRTGSAQRELGVNLVMLKEF
jgi:hypothetical protein